MTYADSFLVRMDLYRTCQHSWLVDFPVNLPVSFIHSYLGCVCLGTWQSNPKRHISISCSSPLLHSVYPLKMDEASVRKKKLHFQIWLGARLSSLLTFASCLSCSGSRLHSSDWSTESFNPSYSSFRNSTQQWWLVTHIFSLKVFSFCVDGTIGI